MNDPAYNSGVGTGVNTGVNDPAYGNTAGNQTTTTQHHGHPAAATMGGAAVGAGAGHELGGHGVPGAVVGGMAGDHASHRHNQAATGYNDNTTSHHPVRNDVGGAALGAEAGHLMGGHAGAGAAAGGFAGHEHAHHNAGAGAGTGPDVVGTGGAGGMNAGGMNSRDARIMEMEGKVEKVAGTILFSQSLKAKGAAKEQEAAALRHQGQNLEEAERHESAAK